MNPYESPATSELPSTAEGEPEEVCLEYDVSVEDIVHFNERFLERYNWFDVVLISVVCFTFAGAKLWPNVVKSIEQSQIVWQEADISSLIAVPIAIPLTVAIWRSFARRHFLRGIFNFTTRLTMLLVGHARMVGRFQLRANAREITEVNSQRSFSFPTSHVGKIMVMPEHIAIYVTLVQAIIIPRRSFTSIEQFERFLMHLEQITSKPVKYFSASATA